MGYSIWIGEHTPQWREDYGEMYYDARNVSEMDGVECHAPLNSSHDHGNFILPSYSSWHDFMRNTGLGKHLSNQGVELIPEHPGMCYITEKVRDAVVDFGRGYLQSHPVIEERTPCRHGMGDRRFRDYDAARMRWLVFWVDWAFNHCTHPVIANG